MISFTELEPQTKAKQQNQRKTNDASRGPWTGSVRPRPVRRHFISVISLDPVPVVEIENYQWRKLPVLAKSWISQNHCVESDACLALIMLLQWRKHREKRELHPEKNTLVQISVNYTSGEKWTELLRIWKSLFFLKFFCITCQWRFSPKVISVCRFVWDSDTDLLPRVSNFDSTELTTISGLLSTWILIILWQRISSAVQACY